MTMTNKISIAAALICASLYADAFVERVTPESLVSKAWTVHSHTNCEMKVTFYRPNVFRIQSALKVADTNVTTSTEISATGQYITTTNASYKVDYSDPLNDPARTQIILPGIKEDASRVYFADSIANYEWRTTALTLRLDKSAGTFACYDNLGNAVFAEAKPIEIFEASADDEAHTVEVFRPAQNANYFGGGQQNGSWIHTGRTIDIIADSNWAEGGHPNPAPWMLVRVDKGIYYGILRHTFSPGRYDFTNSEGGAGPIWPQMRHEETRFDAFYFIGKSFGEVLDRYTEFTGRPNFIPVWGLELGDADAWMTRDKSTREPKQDTNTLAYVETTPDVIARNAENYRAADMPCGWILVNDGYGCKYMQLGWVVEALASLGFKTGLWTEGALDRIRWEVGTAGTRIQKIDVAWSGPAYQHGLNCNKAAYDGFIENSFARAFIWTCQGWAGTQRYAVCWTGDQYGNFDLIRYHVPTLTGSGMSGQAYATTDIDGIFGGSPESFVRDLEWKCFTPALYIMNGWSNINKAPWSLAEPYKSIARDWLKMKSRLTPYTYALCREAWETGAPIVRPLAWNYPDDPKCLSSNTDYEMMLGRDILVAPVYDSMEESQGWHARGIYLPEGTWYDWNDGRLVEGARTLAAYPVTLSTLPVFVRAGAVIPMYEAALSWAGMNREKLIFDIYPGGEGECTVYEDDGQTRSYEYGEWTKQTVKVSSQSPETPSDILISIEGVRGRGYAGQPQSRRYEFFVHSGAKPQHVLLDGKEVLAISATGEDAARIYENAQEAWWFDEADKGGTLKIKLSPRSPKADVRLEIARGATGAAARAYTPYAEPPEGVLAKLKEKAAVQSKCVAPMNSEHLYQNCGKEFTVELDGTWKRVSGAVVCSKDTDERAVVTFRLVDDKGATLFERVGQKARDAAQILEVNIPDGAKSLTFSLANDGEKVPILGIWKNLKLVK